MLIDFSQPFTEKTPRIVHAAKLHRSATRRKLKQFIVEGENSVDAAVATAAATDIFVTQQAAQRFSEIIETAGHLGIYVHPISEKAAKYLADTTAPTGIFAVCKTVLWSSRKALGHTPRIVSIPVETNDPGNAGTLVRISDAMGADSVIFAGNCVDPQASKVVRSSAGSFFHIPVAKNPDVAEVLEQVRAKNMQIIATSATGEVSLDEADELLAQPTAWLFGNEAHGLHPELLAQADYRVRIPIRGRAESLNLATAAAICVYETAKVQASQRRV
ncbi:RNA methyltransferase [Corynebacterium sp. sy017]|uniref:TrmH family RNA methyltransferase n=1 Tax=unclassified Corynebacterium TaxID=2624378 RepID=UPI0011851D92|nr:MULTISPECIES: RNA methyltransferase [unclassified Corynebacterium]MBP3089181.1 RNA methyltransferase [Corynebacterium sp. sy017]QDZ42532.1 RNA methyltransferase [Corynebacterium sp. sy039]TSD91491.1 RNA methyltransferase [Corynebacterium sp. SY003]